MSKSSFGWNSANNPQGFTTPLIVSIDFRYLEDSNEKKKRKRKARPPSLQMRTVLRLSHFDFHHELHPSIHPSVASSNRHLRAVPFIFKAASAAPVSQLLIRLHPFVCVISSNHHPKSGRTGHLQVHRSCLFWCSHLNFHPSIHPSVTYFRLTVFRCFHLSNLISLHQSSLPKSNHPSSSS